MTGETPRTTILDRHLTRRDRCLILRSVKLNPEALKVIRERSGMSKAELAEAAGIDRTLITRLENGERTGTPNVIARLAAALRCSQIAITRDEATVA